MDDFLLARVIDGRYLIRRRLGRGSAGAVFEGEHLQTKRRVAVKVLHYALAGSAELRGRFEREAQSASRLSHPACVSVIDFGRIAKIEPAGGTDDLLGMPYLVMEFVKGELLLDRIQRGRLEAPEALRITRGLLSGLRHAHGLGIVHRDVKPENIMLSHVGDAEPLVKLLDFGLAKDITPDGDDDAKQAMSEQGLVFGSPGYLSPEQSAGQPADARSDLYSLGIVLFEMVCGRPPFVRSDLREVLHDHLVTPPPSPRTFTPSLSWELEAVIGKLLAKEPERRFQTADELQAGLAGCPEWEGSGAADPAWSTRIRLIDPPFPSQSTPPQPMIAAAAATPSQPLPAVVAPPSAPIVVSAPPIQQQPQQQQPQQQQPQQQQPQAATMPRPLPRPPSLDISLIDLRPTRLRNIVVIVVVLLVAVAATARLTFHRWAALQPLVAVGGNGNGVGPARAAESKLSPAGQRHLLAAQDFAHKFWCSAAIDELETGLHEAPELHGDPELTRMMIPCLRAKTQDKTLEFLVTIVGRDAKPILESALTEDLKPDVRDGVQRALARIASRR